MVTPPPIRFMITIDYCDGNRFLARQRRQSGPPSKTLPSAAFAQQWGFEAAKERTPGETFAQHRIRHGNHRAGSSVDNFHAPGRQRRAIARANAQLRGWFATGQLGRWFRTFPRRLLRSPLIRCYRCRPPSEVGAVSLAPASDFRVVLAAVPSAKQGLRAAADPGPVPSRARIAAMNPAIAAPSSSSASAPSTSWGAPSGNLPPGDRSRRCRTAIYRKIAEPRSGGCAREACRG
jgi:hypothetical protein